MSRGRPPGGPKFGGRKPGTTNRVNSKMIEDALANCPGWNPIQWLMETARTSHMPTYDPLTGELTYVKVGNDIRVRCCTEGASYMYPKMKSIEVTNGDAESATATSRVEIVIMDASK